MCLCAGITPDSENIADGGKEGEGIMYHANSYPWNPIGVVWFLWKFQPAVDKSSTGPLPDLETTGTTSLWVWCHPSIYDEVLCLFKSAASECVCTQSLQQEEIVKGASNTVSYSQSKSDSSQGYFSLDKAKLPSFNGPNISVRSLREELLRFRLVGPKSHLVLSTVLVPDFDFDYGSEDDEMEGVHHLKSIKGWEEISKKSKLRKWWKAHVPLSRHASLLRNHYSTINSQDLGMLSFGSVIGMTLIDPRLFTPVKKDSLISVVATESKASAASLLHKRIYDHAVDISGSESGSDWSAADTNELYCPTQVTRSALPTTKNTTLSCDSSKVEALPMELAYSPLWDSSIRIAVSNSFIPNYILNNVRSKFLVKPKVLHLGCESNRVPILLVNKSKLTGSRHGLTHRNVHLPSVTSWDVILPRCWGMAFWISLVYHGGRASGVKELERAYFELLQPVFPRDFPDTKPGMNLALEKKLVLEAKYCRYPPDKRPNFGKLQIRSPFYSPLSSLVKEHHKVFAQLSDDNQLLEYAIKSNQSKRAKFSVELSADSNDVPLSVSPDVPKESLSPNSKIPLPVEFYVLRETKCIQVLVQFAEQLLSRSLPPSIAYNTLFQQLGITKFYSEHKSALLLLQIESARRGVLTDLSTISLPTMKDLCSFRENADYCGPWEDEAPRGLTLVENGELCIGVYQTTRKEMKSQTSKSNRSKIKSSAGGGLFKDNFIILLQN